MKKTTFLIENLKIMKKHGGLEETNFYPFDIICFLYFILYSFYF